MHETKFQFFIISTLLINHTVASDVRFLVLKIPKAYTIAYFLNKAKQCIVRDLRSRRCQGRGQGGVTSPEGSGPLVAQQVSYSLFIFNAALPIWLRTPTKCRKLGFGNGSRRLQSYL